VVVSTAVVSTDVEVESVTTEAESVVDVSSVFDALPLHEAKVNVAIATIAKIKFFILFYFLRFVNVIKRCLNFV
jgi:hypothetical protein